MSLAAFELKIDDLPKTLEVEMQPGASTSDVEEMLDSVRSQIVYNSRSIDDDKPIPSPKVEVLERKGDTIKLKIDV